MNPTDVPVPAGIVTRVLAALIDAVAVAVLTGGVLGAMVAAVFLANPVSFSWPHNLGAQTSLLAVAVAVGYLTIGWATAGRTVGGAVLGVRVVARGGGRLGWLRSVCRAVLCVVVPLGLLWAAVSARRRSLQDLLVRSTVLYDAPAPTASAAR
jgi:uncharacterized RDD family membrane protein YckC